MRTDKRGTMITAPGIAVLPTGQPRLRHLASVSAHGGLTADAVLRIRRRIAAGFYDSPSVLEAIARRIAPGANM